MPRGTWLYAAVSAGSLFGHLGLFHFYAHRAYSGVDPAALFFTARQTERRIANTRRDSVKKERLSGALCLLQGALAGLQGAVNHQQLLPEDAVLWFCVVFAGAQLVECVAQLL